MSQENVEIVRRSAEAFNRGDLDAAVADAAPDIEYVPTGANVEIVRKHIDAFRRGDPAAALSHLDPYVVWDASRGGLLDVIVAYGHEEFSQTIRRYIGAFEDYDYDAERLTDLGSGAVLAVLTEEGRGRSSGVPCGSPSPRFTQ